VDGTVNATWHHVPSIRNFLFNHSTWEIIYFIIIHIVLYYHRYIINCYNSVAELYSCPKNSVSHDREREKEFKFALYNSLSSADAHARIVVFFTINYARRFSSFVTMFRTAKNYFWLTKNYFRFLPLSDLSFSLYFFLLRFPLSFFLSFLIFPMQSVCLHRIHTCRTTV